MRATRDTLPRCATLRYQPHQAAGAACAQSDRTAIDRGARDEKSTVSITADARRVPGIGTARFLRDGARLHGGLRPQELPDCPVTEPDREGLWAEQLHSRQLPCPGLLRD